jgi:hybrid polyketide synthase/nonribosomal peptide synthetase ACE1
VRLFISWDYDKKLIISHSGQRLDLREVEQAIEESCAAHGDTVEAVVTVRKSGQTGLEFLVAHVLATSKVPNSIDEKTMQDMVSRLPLSHYMKPSIVIPVDDLPMTEHGKRDRSAIAKLELPKSNMIHDQNTSMDLLTGVEKKLLNVWRETVSREVLQLHQITPDSDFFLVGGNSILLLALQAKIKESFEFNIPLVRLFELSTLRGMASNFSNRIPESTAEIIDWEVETTLDELPPSRVTRHTQKEDIAVVLTGATGFLGQSILRRLIDQPRVKKIHCIAVRTISKLDAFLESEKVQVYEGNLSEPDFGLSLDEMSAVFGETDIILHNGAEVSFLKSYTTLRLANVSSTRNLIRLSIQYGTIPIHYVSTAGVAWLSGQETFAERSASDIVPPDDGSNGYVASKWASERLLEKAAEKYETSVCIYRPSNITGDNISEQDVMHSIIRYSRKIKAAPSMGSAWKGYLNFVSVDQSAEYFIEMIMHRIPHVPSQVQFVNVVGDEDIPVAELREYLEKTDPRTWYKTLPLGKWIEKAEAEGLHALTATYLRQVESKFPTIVLSRLLKSRTKHPFVEESSSGWGFVGSLMSRK